MEKHVFLKKEATGKEKATKIVFDMERQGVVYPRFKGEEEAETRLCSNNEQLRYCPCVFVTNKNGYIPVKFRNEEYFVL